MGAFPLRDRQGSERLHGKARHRRWPDHETHDRAWRRGRACTPNSYGFALTASLDCLLTVENAYFEPHDPTDPGRSASPPDRRPPPFKAARLQWYGCYRHLAMSQQSPCDRRTFVTRLADSNRRVMAVLFRDDIQWAEVQLRSGEIFRFDVPRVQLFLFTSDVAVAAVQLRDPAALCAATGQTKPVDLPPAHRHGPAKTKSDECFHRIGRMAHRQTYPALELTP